METLLNQLELNLKELYRKAVDADATLQQLRQQGHGKYQQVFVNDGLFQTQSEFFMPYLSETAELIYLIRQSGQFNTATLQKIVLQLQTLHKTLAEFRTAL